MASPNGVPENYVVSGCHLGRWKWRRQFTSLKTTSFPDAILGGENGVAKWRPGKRRRFRTPFGEVKMASPNGVSHITSRNDVV